MFPEAVVGFPNRWSRAVVGNKTNNGKDLILFYLYCNIN
jgi:hypothetical protein